MKKMVLNMAVALAFVMTAASCNNEEYAVVDIPVGAVTLTHKLTPENLPETPAGETNLAFEKEYRFSDDNFLNRLEYYKDQKDITVTIDNIRFRVDPQRRTANDATGGIDNVLLSASVDGVEIARFEIDNIPKGKLGDPIRDNAEYENFINTFFNAIIVDKKTVKLRCSGTIVGFKASNANANLADYVFLQDISTTIRIKR